MAGTGTIGKQLQDLQTTAPAAVTTKPVASATSKPAAAWPTAAKHGDGPMMVVPAGFIGDILGGLSGTLGELTGGYFGNAQTGKAIGEALSDPIKSLVPFSIVPPAVAPQSAGPDAGHASSEALVVVPAGFLGGLLGGIGGGLLGGTVGDWLGDKATGKTIGETAGSVLGGILPFAVLPPSVAPQAAGPAGAATPGEPMVVVPAGFFGDLVSGITSTVGNIVGGDTGSAISGIGSLGSLLPFSTVPPELAPASAGPDGVTKQDDLVVLPAGFLGSLLTGLAGTIAGSAGAPDWAQSAINSAASALSDVLPFHAVPPALLPASAAPAGTAPDPRDQLMVVPAGLFGSLLSGLAGTIGGAVGGLVGDSDTGKAIGNAASGLISMLPFHTVPPAMVAS
jgi:hypothetical protein